MQLAYRGDIDGLRAVAVLVVVLFHLGIPGFSGGYVGVDVFFVISGFLITGLLRGELRETGRIAFARFYARRARRLLPALIATILASWFAACFFISPSMLRQLALESATAGVWLSNFYFWWQSDYFNDTAILKPLLHTWSLGVEEQFYLFWPLFLLAFHRLGHRAMLAAILVAFAASLAISQADLAKTAFYLTPWRIFEFAVGAALLWLPAMSRSARDALVVAGLVLIAATVALYDAETPFPGVAALVPALGAAAIIAGGEGRFGGLLRWRPAVAIGRASYALYLVHWPVVVLGTAASLPVWLLPPIMAAATLALHFGVERPLRHSPALGRPWIALGASLSTALFIVLLSASSWFGDGWSWRLPPPMVELLASAREGSHDPGGCRYGSGGVTTEFRERFLQCTAEGPAVLILGDSHGGDLFPALSLNSVRPHVAGLVHGSCRPGGSRAGCQYEDAITFIAENRVGIEAVVFSLAGAWMLRSGEPLPQRIEAAVAYLQRIRALGIPVVWVGPQWEPGLLPDTIGFAVPPESVLLARNRIGLEGLDEILRRRSSEAGFAYVSKLDILGPMTTGRLIVDNRLTYADRDHWSATGERIFGRELIAGSAVLAEYFPPAAPSPDSAGPFTLARSAPAP
jgi:peptidoglycan/LPS O-acetylase OafA/YrhL